jgi:4-hydroxy-2-oxoheptanedioate aldolase
LDRFFARSYTYRPGETLLQRSRFRDLLARGENPLGIFVGFSDPSVVEILGHAGFDFCVIDTEHLPLDFGDVQNLVRAAEVVGVTPLVRVSENNPKFILRVLETGAAGIMVPHVKDAADAERAVRAVKYLPRGGRSLHGAVRAADYGRIPLQEHLASSNVGTIVIVQIEEREAVDRIEEIVRVPDLDSLFVGPVDLSASYGVPGRLQDPQVAASMERVVKATREAGLWAGRFMARLDEAETLLRAGIQYFVFSTDTALLMNCCHSAVEFFRNKAREQPSSGKNRGTDLVERITGEVLKRLGRIPG